MKFAFFLYKYFPYGGLQRDFLRIARECQRRGHQVKAYTLVCEEMPEDIDVTVVPVNALFNHNKYQRYTDWVQRAVLDDPVDCIVGFNKMPGLDIYYAADSCYEEKTRTQRNWIYRQIPRYKHFAHYERSVFDRFADTRLLMISNAQKPFFVEHYDTPEERMRLLPPGISRDRVAPPDAEEIRERKRAELGLTDDQYLILFVGSGFIKKGLRRAILAIHALPTEFRSKIQFFVIGDDRSGQFIRLINRLGLESNIHLIGGRNDVPEYLLAGDLLLHPASDENAGMVLLEAMVAGLPVLATDICGYGHYVEDADMGMLVRSPFKQEELNSALLTMLKERNREKYAANGRAFAESADIYSLPEVAVDAIEEYMAEPQRQPFKIPATAAIIAKDESRHIEACIRSVDFFDEVLVVDSGSSDDTMALARKAGARAVYHPWSGYSPQRRFALEQAKHDWIFSIDADERVSRDLRRSIILAFENELPEKGFAVNRRNHFMGRALGHGEGYPDWILRLFNRKYARWSMDSVHEKVTIEGEMGRLAGELNHYSEDTLSEYLIKQNRYTNLQAVQMYEAGKRSSLGKLIASPIVRFFKFYLIRLGFLDGIPGLIHIAFGCFNSFTKYAKLRELQQLGPPEVEATPSSPQLRVVSKSQAHQDAGS